jgi:hypothetical protein
MKLTSRPVAHPFNKDGLTTTYTHEYLSVQELIDELQKVEDKTQIVFVNTYEDPMPCHQVKLITLANEEDIPYSKGERPDDQLKFYNYDKPSFICIS